MTVHDATIAFNTSATTIQNVKASYGEKGPEATLNRKKRETPPVETKVTEDVEAHIIALACGEPSSGYDMDSLTSCGQIHKNPVYIDSISHTHV